MNFFFGFSSFLIPQFPEISLVLKIKIYHWVLNIRNTGYLLLPRCLNLFLLTLWPVPVVATVDLYLQVLYHTRFGLAFQHSERRKFSSWYVFSALVVVCFSSTKRKITLQESFLGVKKRGSLPSFTNSQRIIKTMNNIVHVPVNCCTVDFLITYFGILSLL